MPRVVVRIFNREYALKSPESPEDLVKYAAWVEKHMKEAADSGLISVEKIAVAAALNIAAEYFKVKEKLEDITEEIEKRTEKLAHLMDQIKGEGGQ